MRDEIDDFIRDHNVIRQFVQNNRHVLSLYPSWKDGDFSIAEIGDGNLNYIFHLYRSQQQQGLIIKKAMPYLRCVGEKSPLTAERIAFEARALKKYLEIVPEWVPRIYDYDPLKHVIIMQDLSPAKNLRQVLHNTPEKNLNFIANQIAHFLAKSAFFTSTLALSSTEKRLLQQEFINNHDLCFLTENYVFSYPYFNHQSNRDHDGLQTEMEYLRRDEKFKTEVLKLKNIFMNNAECLVHGSFHNDSIMVTINKAHIYVIDPEFAFVGPMGFDLGTFIAHFLLAYCAHPRLWFLHIIEQVVDGFQRKFLRFWHDYAEMGGLISHRALLGEANNRFQQEYMQKVISEALGFAGMEMCRRQMGLVGSKDIEELIDVEERRRAKIAALHLGSHLVKNYTSMKQWDHQWIFDQTPKAPTATL